MDNSKLLIYKLRRCVFFKVRFKTYLYDNINLNSRFFFIHLGTKSYQRQIYLNRTRKRKVIFFKSNFGMKWNSHGRLLYKNYKVLNFLWNANKVSYVPKLRKLGLNSYRKGLRFEMCLFRNYNKFLRRFTRSSNYKTQKLHRSSLYFSILSKRDKNIFCLLEKL